MKRVLLNPLLRTLQQLKSLDGHLKFHFALIKNVKAVQKEIENVEELKKSLSEKIPNFMEFQKQEQEIVKKHQNPELSEEDHKAINEEYEKFKTENKETVEAVNAATKELEEFVHEEMTLNLHKVDAENLPETMNGQALELLIEAGMVDLPE